MLVSWDNGSAFVPFNSLPGRVCSFTYSETAKEIFHPEKEHRLVLQLKDRVLAVSTWETMATSRSWQDLGSTLHNEPPGSYSGQYTQCSKGQGPGNLLYGIISCNDQHHPRRYGYYSALQMRKLRLSKVQSQCYQTTR